MAVNVREMRCTPEDVFAVLADGWLYASWVVGASRMRDVSADWPAEGAVLHHSFGVWPVVTDDTTHALESDRPRRLVLQARGWPMGEARVTIDVKERTGSRCVVRLEEVASKGPATWIPRPLFDVLVHWRNTETLRRLAFLAEGNAAGTTTPTAASDVAPAA